MPFTAPWDETSPSGSQDISLGDDRIREFKTQIRERLAVDHHYPSLDDASTGYHEKATLLAQLADPLAVSSAMVLYAKLGSSETRELFSRHETAAAQQLTLNGKLWLSALSITGQSVGDIPYFDGTIFNRLVMGAARQQIRVNADRSGLEYFTSLFTESATQDAMESAIDDTMVVTPLKAKYHPGAAKAYCVFNGNTAGTNAPIAGYNVTSVQRISQGRYAITVTNPLSNANCSVVGTAKVTTSSYGEDVCVVVGIDKTTDPTASVITISTNFTLVNINTGVPNLQAIDSSRVCVAIYGDL